MIYLDLLYLYSLLRKQHVKCGPPADRLDCSISTKMASQPCGGTIANTVRVFTATILATHFNVLRSSLGPALIVSIIVIYSCATVTLSISLIPVSGISFHSPRLVHSFS